MASHVVILMKRMPSAQFSLLFILIVFNEKPTRFYASDSWLRISVFKQ